MLRFLIVLTTLAVLVSLTPITAYAIGGNRKGFVLGAGFGFSPVAYHRIGTRTSENHTGPLTTIAIGYGFRTTDLLVIEGTTTFWAEGKYSSWVNNSNLRWYHFQSTDSKANFFSVGIGAMSWEREDGAGEFGFLVGTSEKVVGPGISIGYGRELLPRCLLHVHLGVGFTRDRLMIQFGPMLTFMGY